MTEPIKIPYGNWTTALANAIENAPIGAVIECHSEAMIEPGRGAAIS